MVNGCFYSTIKLLIDQFQKFSVKIECQLLFVLLRLFTELCILVYL